MKRYTIKAINLDEGRVQILKDIYTSQQLKPDMVFTHNRISYKIKDWKKKRMPEDEFIPDNKYLMVNEFVDKTLLSLKPKESVWMEELLCKHNKLNQVYFGVIE